VILCDTGPLIALIDEDDPDSARCHQVMRTLPVGRLITTWPCFSEAMYMLQRNRGIKGWERLLGLLANEFFRLHETSSSELIWVRALMRQYFDTPMDFADASLVATAERLGTRRIFTIDSHFRIYKIKGKHSFEVIP
jgi:predicted nucleic acid-binding protein